MFLIWTWITSPWKDRLPRNARAHTHTHTQKLLQMGSDRLVLHVCPLPPCLSEQQKLFVLLFSKKKRRGKGKYNAPKNTLAIIQFCMLCFVKWGGKMWWSFMLLYKRTFVLRVFSRFSLLKDNMWPVYSSVPHCSFWTLSLAMHHH